LHIEVFEASYAALHCATHRGLGAGADSTVVAIAEGTGRAEGAVDSVVVALVTEAGGAADAVGAGAGASGLGALAAHDHASGRASTIAIREARAGAAVVVIRAQHSAPRGSRAARVDPLARTRHDRGVSNVVNLNKFRKAKAKAEAKKRAETNVRLHGRTKAERELEAKQKELLARRVDGARLGPADEEEGDGEGEGEPGGD
jgi:hypothetical protein